MSAPTLTLPRMRGREWEGVCPVQFRISLHG